MEQESRKREKETQGLIATEWETGGPMDRSTRVSVYYVKRRNTL